MLISGAEGEGEGQIRSRQIAAFVLGLAVKLPGPFQGSLVTEAEVLSNE